MGAIIFNQGTFSKGSRNDQMPIILAQMDTKNLYMVTNGTKRSRFRTVKQYQNGR